MDDSALSIVLRAIERAADAGEPAPTNVELASMLGIASIGTPPRYVAALEASGVIRVERFHSDRRITVVATGRQTALRRRAKPGRWSAPEVRTAPAPPPPPEQRRGADGLQLVPPFRLFSEAEEAAFDEALADGFSIETAARYCGRSLLDGYRQFHRVCAELGEPPREQGRQR